MSTGTVIGIVVGIAILNTLVVLFVVNRRGAAQAGALGPNPMDQSMSLMLQHINDLSKTIDQKMGESSRQVHESTQRMHESVKDQFGESQRLVNKFIGEITAMTDKVARVEETGKQMVGFADQLQSLQDILKNPKQRGILGEYYLETLLKNVLPTGSYQMQYAFEDGTIVDAVVFVKDKIIPIDSKFSLENYNRLVEEKDPVRREEYEAAFKKDLKNRIDETAKYVKPAENTMDFAFMFIPHEAIYYDLLVAQVGAVKVNTRDLIEYAFKDKRVIIVSPTSFLAYLQTVLQGLKALQIEESAKEIRKRVEDLGKHLAAYEQYMGSLGASLGTTVNHFNKAHKELGKIDKDVIRITGASAGFEPVVIVKPEMGESE
jgi:DNA recombination protein RmuC